MPFSVTLACIKLGQLEPYLPSTKLTRSSRIVLGYIQVILGSIGVILGYIGAILGQYWGMLG